MVSLRLTHLNTSYVDIKHFDTCAYTARYVNLNTSYVDIKQSDQFITRSKLVI